MPLMRIRRSQDDSQSLRLMWASSSTTCESVKIGENPYPGWRWDLSLSSPKGLLWLFLHHCEVTVGFVLRRDQRPGSPCHTSALARSRAPGRPRGRPSAGHKALPWGQTGTWACRGSHWWGLWQHRAVGSWSPILLWSHWAELTAPGLTWGPVPG